MNYEGQIESALRMASTIATPRELDGGEKSRHQITSKTVSNINGWAFIKGGTWWTGSEAQPLLRTHSPAPEDECVIM